MSIRIRSHITYPPIAKPAHAHAKKEMPEYSGVVTIFNPWSEADIATLKKLVAEGYAYSMIARLMGRTEGGVGAKGRLLGLKKP